MPSIIKYYLRTIDFISLKTGRATMYLVFVMMFILILSFLMSLISIRMVWVAHEEIIILENKIFWLERDLKGRSEIDDIIIERLNKID